MEITERLESRARAVVRAARDRHRRRTGKGPRAAYANILDGERLWLALEEGAGEPALRHLATGEILRPVSDLPPGDSDLEPGYRSVRWPLSDALPAEDGATFEVISLPPSGGDPELVRVVELSASHAVRHPTTADGEWKFDLERAHLGALHVCRLRAQPVTQVLRAAFVNRCAVITCEALGRDSADLLLVETESGELAARLPMVRSDLGFERVIGDDDLPPEPARYRVLFGSDMDDAVPVARRRNDLRIIDPLSVLMPLVISPETGLVAGRTRYAPDGTLRVLRVDPTEEYA